MTTNATTEPKLKKFLRRLFNVQRPTPFWRKRLDDMVEPAEPIVVDDGWDPSDNVFTALMVLVVGALVISALALLVIGPLFLSPDFFTIGFADPLGRWYASVCVATGRCDLPYLLGGTVIGLLIATLAALVLHASFRGLFSLPVEEKPDYEIEIVQALGVLDERLVRFRADLVLAGILPLSLEEREEDEEDESEEAERAARTAARVGRLPFFAIAGVVWLSALALDVIVVSRVWPVSPDVALVKSAIVVVGLAVFTTALKLYDRGNPLTNPEQI